MQASQNTALFNVRGGGGIGINAKARELINLRGFRHSRIKKKCHMETENHYKEVLKRSQ